MKVKNFKDEIELTDVAVVIRKAGLANAMASGMNGERSLLYASITSVGFKPYGMFSPGYIQIAHAGAKPFRGGVWEATQDPDSLVFSKEVNGQMEALRDELQRRIKNAQSPVAATSLAAELERIAAMRDKGDLTLEEFQHAKTRLIGG